VLIAADPRAAADGEAADRSLGRVLFAPAVDTDGDPATNPTAGNPLPIVDLDGEMLAVVVLAAQLAPDDGSDGLIGIPLTFYVRTADGTELSRTVRSDAWGAASAEFPLLDLSTAYTYQVSAPGYAETEVRRFRVDPERASYTMRLDGAQLAYEQLADGVVRFTLRSSVPLEAERDEAVLYVVRRPLGDGQVPAKIRRMAGSGEVDDGEEVDGVVDAVPLPLLTMAIADPSTAVAEVRLPEGAYGVVGGVTSNGEQTLHAYSQPVALDIDEASSLPVSPCVWASAREYEAGRTLIRLEDQGDRVLFDLVPTAQVPEVIPTPEHPGVFVKTWRTGPFEWREVRYDIQVESLVDDGKKTITLQNFDYDPISRRYTLAIRSLLDEAVTDTLRVDVLGPGDVVLMHQERQVVLVPGQALLYEIEVPTELGEPQGLRVALDDPITQILNALQSVGSTLKNKLGDALSVNTKFYAVVMGFKFAEYQCVGNDCQWADTKFDMETILKEIYKDMLSSGDFVVGMAGFDFSVDFTAPFEVSQGPCPTEEGLEEAKNRVSQVATDINNLLDDAKPNLGSIKTPKMPLAWMLLIWFEITPFFRGTCSTLSDGLGVNLGVQAGYSAQGKIGFGLGWGTSMQDLWTLIVQLNSIADIVLLAEELEKLQVEDACEPDKRPPDDRQDVWQGFGDLFRGETHEETISNLVDIVERAREQGLWRAERLLVLELREAELARFMADRAAQMAYVQQADAVMQALQDDVGDLLDGTMPVAPGQTITETWIALTEQAIADLENLDYAQEQQRLVDAVELAQRGYDELYGQELELQHEIRELLMSDTVGVLALGFAGATRGVLMSAGLPSQLVSPWSSGTTFQGRYAPYVPPQAAPQLLVVPAGGMGTVATSPEARAWLEAYVDGGGLLIVFTQARGADWAALPGGEVAGVGYLEDQRCQHASVEAGASSDWLVWMGVERPDIQVDGAFTAWPDNATILLRRTKGDYAGFPAMIEYPYGQGTVLATTAYGDWAFETDVFWGDDWQMTRTIMLRAWLLIQGQDVGDVPVGEPSSLVSVSFPLTNTASYTATEVRVAVPVEISYWWGYRYETRLSQTIGPGASVTISADVPTPSTRRYVHNWTRVGLYRTRLAVRGSGWRQIYRPWGPIVYVRSPVARPELTLDLQPERGRGNLFETLLVTATVRSSLSEDATVVLNPERDLPGAPITHTVPAMGQIEQVYTVTMDASKIPSLRLDGEGGEYLDRATTAIRLDYPRVVGSVAIPPILAHGAALTLTVENQGLGALLAGSAALTLTTPSDVPIWTAGQALPTLAAGEVVTLPFVLSLPSGPELGTYTLWYRVDDGRGLVKASPVPLPTLAWQWALDRQAYRVREQLAFTATVENVGRFELAPVVTVTVPALGFEDVRTSSLPVGASESLPFGVTLPHTLTAGAYDLVVEARQGTTISNTETFVIAPSEMEASLAGGSSYPAGETLTVTLSNVGGADTDVDYELRLSHFGRRLAQVTGTLSIETGGSAGVALSIPVQAADGSDYSLRLLADDLAAGRCDQWTWPVAVEGVAAGVHAWTLDADYRAGETVTATGEVSVTAGSLISGPLALAVYGAQGVIYDHLDPGMGPYYNCQTPAIAADADGNAFAVWTDDRYGNDVHFASRTETGPWSADVNLGDITDALGAATFSPDIAVDSAGTAHVVWVDYREGYQDIYYAQRSTAGVWSGAERVNADDGTGRPASANPAVAADGAGNVYVVWQQTGRVYFAYRPAAGGWSAKERVDSSSDADQEYPAIAVDGASTAYVLWQDDRNGFRGDIYFSYRPATGTWQTSVRVNDDAGDTYQRMPAIAVDTSGHVYAAWEDARSYPYDIYFAHRPPGGSWSTNEQVDTGSGNTGHQTRPAILVDDQGVHATWRDGRWWGGIGDIFYARRTPAGVWNASFKINTDSDPSGTHAQDSPDIARDGDGNWYFIWSDGRHGTNGSRMDIYSRKRYSDYSGWEAEAMLNDDDSAPQDQFEPSVAVTPEGHAFAVWEDHRNGGHADIYFAHRPAGGTWSAAERVNDDVGDVRQDVPRIAVDHQGNAFAVWEDRRNGDYDIYFAYRPITGTWSTNRKVNASPAEDGEAPAIAADPEGNTYVIWQQEGPIYDDIWFSYRAADGTWSANELVNEYDGNWNWYSKPDIDVDADGNAYAVWENLDGSSFLWSIESDYRPAGGIWGTDAEVTDEPGSAYDPAIAVDAAGNAHALWQDWREPSGIHVYGAYRPAGGLWSSDVRVDDDPEGWEKAYEGLGLDVDDAGNAFAAWDDTRWRDDIDIALAYRPAGGEWGPQMPVNEPGGDAWWDVDVAADAYGNAHVVWIDTPDGGTLSTHYAIVKAPVPLWSRALTVTTATTWPFTETVGTLNAAPGRYVLAATLENSLGQTLARSREPFYVHPLSLTLTLETDRYVYRSGDTVHVSGWVTNTGTTSDTWDLVVMAGSETLYTDTLQLDADQGAYYTATKVITQDLLLTASAGPARVYADVAVGEPEVAAALEAPPTVGRDPFTVTLVLTNTGLVSAALQVDFDGQAARAATVDAGGTALVQASLSLTESRVVEVAVSGDAALTLTQWVAQGELAEVALLDGGANLRAGPAYLPYTITNPGTLPARVELSATLRSEVLHTHTRSLLILAGGVYTGELTFDVPPGEHQLTLVVFDAYGREMGRRVYELWVVADEEPEEPDAFLTDAFPWPQPVGAGEALSVTLTVRNEGAGGAAVAGVQAFDVARQRAVSLTGQLTETLVLTVPVPVDTPAGDYVGQASLDGGAQPFTFAVAGVDVGLALSLDQTGYISGEVASLVVTLTEKAGLSGDYNLSFRYLSAEDYVTVTVPAHQVVTHTFPFTATAPGRASVTMAYTPSEAGQRIIMIDSLPVPVADPGQGFTLTHDKAVYDAGDTISLTLAISGGVGSLMLMGPMELMGRDGDFLLWRAPFDAENMQAAPGTYTFSVTLPMDLTSGQYGFLVKVDGESVYHTVDVRGWQVTSMGVSLDHVRYAPQDTLVAVGQFFNEGETALTGLTLSVWVVPPDGAAGLQLTPPVSRTVDLQPGLNVFTATGGLDTPYPGTHRLVLSLKPHGGCCRVAGGSTHFDVGWAHLVELQTDQGTYEPGEVGEGSLQAHGYGPTSLVVTVTRGSTLLDVQRDLSGYETLTFTIPTTPTGDYVLVAQSTDQNGNTDRLLRAYAVPEPRDTELPSVELTHPTTATVITTAAPTATLTIKGSASDDSGQVTVVVQGQVVTPTATGAFSMPVEVAQGVNPISAAAIDASGNVSYTPVVAVYLVPRHGVTFSVDRSVARICEQVTYQVVLTSCGVISDVSLFQSLPTAMVSDVSLSAPWGETSVGDLDPEWRVANWSGDLYPDEPVTVTVTATLTVLGTLTQTARVYWGWAVEESDPVELEVSTAPFEPDVNDDGIVDILDVQLLASHWRCQCCDGCYEAIYDLNDDCRIDVVDIMLVVAHWGELTSGHGPTRPPQDSDPHPARTPAPAARCAAARDPPPSSTAPCSRDR
jgi:hypothetical protein